MDATLTEVYDIFSDSDLKKCHTRWAKRIEIDGIQAVMGYSPGPKKVLYLNRANCEIRITFDR